jgi:polyisoprenoid-binding protein YceI
MKLVVGAVALGLALVPAIGRAETRWMLDPTHTTVMFEAPHIGFARIFGFFQRVEGEFVFDEATRSITYLRVKVDVESVFTNDADRDQHLRSPDFLDADDHPVAEFVMTDADPASDTTGQIIGDLTLRGVTKPVTLDVTYIGFKTYPAPRKPKVGFQAVGTINKTQWGMAAGGSIADNVKIEINAEFTQK